MVRLCLGAWVHPSGGVASCFRDTQFGLIVRHNPLRELALRVSTTHCRTVVDFSDPSVGPCLCFYGGPRGGVGSVSYERGTPVAMHALRRFARLLGILGLVGEAPCHLQNGFGSGLTLKGSRKVDIMLPGKGNSNFHCARPIRLPATCTMVSG